MGGRGGSSGLSVGVIGRLPDLEGSEKQVSWAKDIREEKLSHYSYDKFMSMEGYIGRNGDFYIENMENFLGVGDKKWKEFKEEYKRTHKRPDKNNEKAIERDKKDQIEMVVKYKKWLWNEFERLAKTQKSAKWWIEVARYRY